MLERAEDLCVDGGDVNNNITSGIVQAPITYFIANSCLIRVQVGRLRKFNRFDIAQRSEAVVLMRYHCEKPSITSRTYASYADIRRVTSLAYSTVRSICLSAVAVKLPKAR